MSYVDTKTHQLLMEALETAVRKILIPKHLLCGDPIQGSFSLMRLEGFGGPACGAAGSIVKRWPVELPFTVELSGRTVRLIAKRVRVGNRTDIAVEEA